VLVLSKACKMPTVMLANFACYGQQYVLFDWMASLVVLMGALLFLLYDGDAAHKHEGHIIENNVGGLVLVCVHAALARLVVAALRRFRWLRPVLLNATRCCHRPVAATFAMVGPCFAG
jgi:hypothetical protein